MSKKTEKPNDIVEFEEASSLSEFTNTPLYDVQKALGEVNVASTEAGTGNPLPVSEPRPSWDEVGLSTPDESGSVGSFDPERPTVEYGGPSIPSSTINYGDLAMNNYGPRPTLPPEDMPEPNGVADHAASEDTTVVSGDESNEGLVRAFNFTPNAVLTNDEIASIARDRIRDVEAAKVRKELELWELQSIGDLDVDLNAVVNEIVGLAKLQTHYLEAYNNFVQAEEGGES